MDLGFNLAQSNRDLKDLTSRQNFGDTSGLLCKNDPILRRTRKKIKIEAQPCDTLEICIHPPNVLHEYQCKIENVWFYTNPRYMFPLLNGKDKAVSLYFHILISPHVCLARI